MTEFDLIYETSQITEIDESLLMEEIILYTKNQYRITHITNHKISIVYDFDRTSDSLNWKWKQFRTILYGDFEVADSKITLKYEIDVLGLMVIFIIIIVASLANPWGLLFLVLLTLQELCHVMILKKESQRILKAITNNTDQPITTKFKTIQID